MGVIPSGDKPQWWGKGVQKCEDTMVPWSPTRVNPGLVRGLSAAPEKNPVMGHILRKYFAQLRGFGSKSMSFKIHDEVLVFTPLKACNEIIQNNRMIY